MMNDESGMNGDALIKRLSRHLTTLDIRHLTFPWMLAVFGLLFCFYASISCRDIYWGDSAELLFVAKTWGIVHPSGYPLYTLFAGIVVGLPFSDTFSLSLLSAFFGALAFSVLSGLLSAIGLTSRKAAAAAVFVGLGASATSQAAVPEVYTLHLFLQFSILLALVSWDKKGGLCRFFGFSLLFGLGFSNHLTSFWLIPPVMAVLWGKRGILTDIRLCLISAAGFILGLTPYLYIPVRAAGNPLWNQGDPTTVSRFFSVATGEIFRYRLFTLSTGEIGDQIRLWAESLVDQWTWAALVFIPLGAFALRRRSDRGTLLAAGLWFTMAFVYIANYFIPDKEGYYLIPHTILGLVAFAGFGCMAGWLAERFSSGKEKAANRAQTIITGLLLIAMAVYSARLSQSENTSLREFTLDTFRHIEAESVLVTEDLVLNYSVLLLQEEGALSKEAAVVSQYLLGFRWYQEFLKRRYPRIVIPASFPAFTKNFAGLGKRLFGAELGNRRQLLVERMVEELMAANIERRPVAMYIHQNDEEQKLFGAFHLQNRGLVYKVYPRAPLRNPAYKCDFSARRLAGKKYLHDRFERRAVSRYATACNRLGIAFVSVKRYDDALKAFNKALRYDPEYWHAMKNRGYVLIRYLNRVEEGEAILKDYLAGAGDEADPAVLEYLKRL